ncbi:MAG: nucleotidyltransferase domain-containing protein [Theionarchaea archaeon]|nr:nucleotidyltransferase domain-containing protein [Theionarchaea archaeon]
MRKRIREICSDLEAQYTVSILFAVENGSRAWRLDSEDSDFDVRFVFVRPLLHYLQIAVPKPVITMAFNKAGERCEKNAYIDISGFDLFKFVQLLANSNPTTIEWLITDIIYYGEQNRVFREFAVNNFSRAALFYHYQSLSRNNFEKYIESGKQVTYKRYLYSLRGLVNALWVLHEDSVPPIIFTKAVEGLAAIIPDPISEEIHMLIEKKLKGKEKEPTPHIKNLDSYILHFIKNLKAPEKRFHPSIDVLNSEIQRIILSNWFSSIT